MKTCTQSLRLLYFVLLCSLSCIPNTALAQGNSSVTTATVVDYFPFQATGLNTEAMGGDNSNTQGSCTISCCSTLVYKLIIPTTGTLELHASPILNPSTGGLVKWPILSSTVPNPTSDADLTLANVSGNQCATYNGPRIVFGITAGEYYLLHSNLSSNSSLTIIFDPYAPSDTLDIALCDTSAFISPTGNVLTNPGSSIEVLENGAHNGQDSLIYINLTVDHEVYTQDNIQDETLNSTDTLRHTATTHLVSTATFDRTEDDWIEANGAVPALAGTNRSAFTWMRKSTQVSGSSQMLISLNTASGGNVCLLQIGTNEELGVYDGATARYTGITVTDGAWHHVGYTYDETTDSTLVYVDGVIHRRFRNSQTVSATNQLSLGQEFDSGNSMGNFYEGEMTEVSIWNEVLTEAEVAMLMEASIQSSHPKYANLQAYYPMIVGCSESIDSLYDYSPNNHTGFASALDIQNTDSLVVLDSFDASGHFAIKWSNTPSQERNASSNTLSNSNPLNVTTFSGGNYTMELSRGYFSITDSWNLTVNVLPIELSYFDGYPAENGVKLLWQTASEQNNMGFELERGQGEAGSIVWENIGFVDGAGTTTEAQDYTFFDANPISGQSFYRIKQIDFDGSVSYSDRIEIQMDQVYKGIGEFYPNPSETGEVYITYPHANEQDLRVSVKVFDLEGKLHIEQVTYLNQGERTLALDLTSLKTGMYLVKLTDRGQTNYRKLIIR